MSGKRDIIKHSGAIHAASQATLLERKIYNVLLLNAFDDLTDQDIFEISVRDLNKWLRFNSNDYESLKDALRTLNRTQAEWNILDKDKEIGWSVTTLLAGVEIINGMCRYTYNPLIKNKLKDPKVYAKLNAFEQTLLKSRSAEILWELCKDYLGIGETPYITIDNLRKLFGIKDNEYPEFKIFFRDVIKKAVSEINKCSTVYVDPKNGVLKKREGRKIVAIKFLIKLNTNNLTKIKKLEEAFRRELSKETSKPKQLPLPMTPSVEIQNETLLKLLKEEFELSEIDAVEIIKKTDEFQLQENLNYVRSWRDSGKIKDSIRGFTVQAISKNWQISSKNKRIKEETKSKNESNKRKRILESIKEAVHKLRKERLKKITSEISYGENKQIHDEFVGKLQSDGNDFVLKQVRKSGLKGSGVKVFFDIFLAERLLPAEIEDLRKYAKELGHEYDELLKEEEN